MFISDTGEAFFSIREAAKEIGVVSATIRNWEKAGIVSPRRIKNGYRIYSRDDVEKMRSLLRYSRDNKMSVYSASLLLGENNRNFVRKHPAVPDKNAGVSAFIGKKWKEYRLERGLALDLVAKAANISPSYLHKIENEQSNVSLDILQRLADYYGENLLYYVAEAKETKHIVRKGGGGYIDIGLEGVSVENLVALSRFHLSVMRYTIEAGHGRTGPQAHHGEEFIYILAGKLHFTLDAVTCVLMPGDSFSFHSETPHSWFNHGKKSASFIWAYTPIVKI
jgi:DNA-binding transcriptional MerR regulator/quercetin dioxygenase-like cupin family protein